MREPGGTRREEEVLEAVREVLRSRVGVQREVGMETDVFADLQLDSLQRIALVVELENRFRVCFEPEDEEGIETIGDAVRLLARRSAEGAG